MNNIGGVQEFHPAQNIIKYCDGMISFKFNSLILDHGAEILLNIVHDDEKRGKLVIVASKNDVMDLSREDVVFHIAELDHKLKLAEYHLASVF